MPFDGTPTKLAPTLENLAKLLRNETIWPDGFVFDFSDCYKCAMGLADKYWGWNSYPCSYIMSQRLGISESAAKNLFVDGEDYYPTKLSYSSITSQDVAFAIESYLATKTL